MAVIRDSHRWLALFLILAALLYALRVLLIGPTGLPGI